MFTNDLLKGKRILITGGGTGIGRAMAERFLQLGRRFTSADGAARWWSKTAEGAVASDRRSH